MENVAFFFPHPRGDAVRGRNRACRRGLRGRGQHQPRSLVAETCSHDFAWRAARLDLPATRSEQVSRPTDRRTWDSPTPWISWTVGTALGGSPTSRATRSTLAN